MRFDILTIFSGLVEPYFADALIQKARVAGFLDIRVHDLRDWTADKHKTVDDAPYGGGPGMVLKVGPIYRAVRDITGVESGKPQIANRRVVLLAAGGEPFTQAKAEEYAKLDQLVLIAGRYEGIDERVAEHIADEEISTGPYVLSGGELPAMAVVEAVSRLIPGVLGNEESIESRREVAPLEHAEVRWPRVSSYPVYTRPEVFVADDGEEWRVPETLLSGNHKEIGRWRRNAAGRASRNNRD